METHTPSSPLHLPLLLCLAFFQFTENQNEAEERLDCWLDIEQRRHCSRLSHICRRCFSLSRARQSRRYRHSSRCWCQQVNPQGVECRFIFSHLPDFVVSELLWAWESLSGVTCCRSLVVVYDCRCIVQIGVAAESVNNEALAVDAAKLMQGSLYQAAIKSASRKWLRWFVRNNSKRLIIYLFYLQRAIWPTFLSTLGDLSCHFYLWTRRWSSLVFPLSTIRLCFLFSLRCSNTLHIKRGNHHFCWLFIWWLFCLF